MTKETEVRDGLIHWRYVREFAGRHNIRNADTEDQMAIVARQSVGKRLRYRDLVA